MALYFSDDQLLNDEVVKHNHLTPYHHNERSILNRLYQKKRFLFFLMTLW